MAYLIKSKGGSLAMRDPSDGKMKQLSVADWVQFEKLPGGIGEYGDGDVAVKEIVKAPTQAKKKIKDENEDE